MPAIGEEFMQVLFGSARSFFNPERVAFDKVSYVEVQPESERSFYTTFSG
jgi:hypothetical protein